MKKAKKQNNVDHPKKSESGTYSWGFHAMMSKEIGYLTSNFIFCYPSVFKRNLSIYKNYVAENEKNITVAEFIVNKLEEEAKDILRKYNYPTDIKKLQSIKDYDPFTDDESNANIQIVNAKQVLLSAHTLRNHIKKNHLEKAVIETFRLMAAAICANIEHIARLGMGMKMGENKSHTKARLPGVILAIKEVKDYEKMSATELWMKLKVMGKDNVLVYKNFYIKFENDILFHRQGRAGAWKDLQFRSFQRYISEIKKTLP